MVELDLEGVSLTRVLSGRYGLGATHATLTIEAIEANRKLAEELDVPTGTALLKTTRISYLADGRPLERTRGWFPGSRYSYDVQQGDHQETTLITDEDGDSNGYP
jgi:GntR family transcriptional regulator